jgi:hypothetical protein
MRAYASPEQQLLLACHEGNRDEALAIVRSHPGIVETLDDSDRRSLTTEAWAANAPAVELMLELGFDPSLGGAGGPPGGSALHCAAWEGCVECVTALLRYPAGRALIETRDPTHHGTPLGWCGHGSVYCGNPRANHAEVARLLIEAGAQVHADVIDASDAVRVVIDSART